nr:MAG TPA: hypothetical protein [Caudoviricetes sp.]DAR51449.1 MAG TPA: hypothetical protein [Caudoviricetes sp.]
MLLREKIVYLFIAILNNYILVLSTGNIIKTN